MLFCAAMEIIASDTDFAAYSPMPEKSLLDFADLFNAEIVPTALTMPCDLFDVPCLAIQVVGDGRGTLQYH